MHRAQCQRVPAPTRRHAHESQEQDGHSHGGLAYLTGIMAMPRLRHRLAVLNESIAALTVS